MIIPLTSDEKAEAQEHSATRHGHMGQAAQHERVCLSGQAFNLHNEQPGTARCEDTQGLGLAGCREESWGGQGSIAGPALLSHI